MGVHDEPAESNVFKLFGADAESILAAANKAVTVAEATKSAEEKHHKATLAELKAVEDRLIVKIGGVETKLQRVLDDHEVELVQQQAAAKRERDEAAKKAELQASELEQWRNQARQERANHASSLATMRGDVSELKTIIGAPPADKDLARASFRDMTREEIELVEKGYGLRGQLAFLLAQAKHQRRVTTALTVGGGTLAAAEIVKIVLHILEKLL